MKKVSIKLETINDVKNFVSAITTFECDFDIVADRYVVDAKSIMGIFRTGSVSFTAQRMSLRKS